MQKRKSLMWAIAGAIALGITLNCTAEQGAVIVLPPTEETPASISKTIGQVVTSLLGEGSKNIYFNPKSFPPGSVSTWKELSDDRLGKFVEKYKPPKLNAKYSDDAKTYVKKFKTYGAEAIQTINTIKFTAVARALRAKTITKDIMKDIMAEIAKTLVPMKKISADVKASLKKLESRIKKHGKNNSFPAVPPRISLAKLEEKLRDALTALDVIIDTMFKHAEKENFEKGLKQRLQDPTKPLQK